MNEYALILIGTILVNNFVLVKFLGLCPFMEYLRTIAFILVIAVVVQFTEMVVHKTSPLLYQVLGIYLPLIATNHMVPVAPTIATWKWTYPVADAQARHQPADPAVA